MATPLTKLVRTRWRFWQKRTTFPSTSLPRFPRSIFPSLTASTFRLKSAPPPRSHISRAFESPPTSTRRIRHSTSRRRGTSPPSSQSAVSPALLTRILSAPLLRRLRQHLSHGNGLQDGAAALLSVLDSQLREEVGVVECCL